MISPLHGRSSARRVHVGRQLSFGALVALTLLLPQRSHAQSEPAGRVEGVVYDSVHARPLAGARVAAAGSGPRADVRRETTTDSVGRFRLDSLPAGRYLVGFESTLLDSLEVMLSPREAMVAPEQVATLSLALPSAAKLRTAVCLGAALPAATGVIYGHVVSTETESPLAGVQIAMTWRDLELQQKKRVRATSREHSESVVTDKDGWYRMCGVPTGAWISMQIQHEQRTSPVVRTRVDDTLGIAIQHLSLSTGSPGSSENVAENAANAPSTGTATLSGVVRGTAGTPVASAEVRVRGTRADTRTDAQGAFTLRGLPDGTQQLEVRRVGYAMAEMPVELRSGATTSVNVALRRIVNLDSVIIVASRPKYPDFYIHKSSGFGRFMGPEEIAMQRVSRTSDIIEKMPNFIVEQRGYRSIVMAQAASFGMCPAAVVIDGQRVLEYPPNVDDVHPSNIGAIEIYSPFTAAMAPPEYGPPSACGMIAIWTKR